MKLAVPGTIAGLFAIGCFCCGSDATQTIKKFVPALQEVNEDFRYEDVACEPAFNTPKPMGCYIEKISCGDVIEGNNAGGPERFGDDMYVRGTCTPERHDYTNTPEAVYALTVPPDTRAKIRLDSNCADLDLVAFFWDDLRSCPTADHAHLFRECEMETNDGSGKVMVTTVDKARNYLVAVDGKRGATGNFRLTVECLQGR